MKWILSILVVIALTLELGYAQEKKVLDGIGFLRLGMTEKGLKEAIVHENKKQEYIHQHLKKSNPELFQKKPPGKWKNRKFKIELKKSLKKEWEKLSIEDNEKIELFTIDKYIPIEGYYYFDNVELAFYNDTLFHIESRNTNIYDLLIHKYPDYITDTSSFTTEHYCDPFTVDEMNLWNSMDGEYKYKMEIAYSGVINYKKIHTFSYKYHVWNYEELNILSMLIGGIVVIRNSHTTILLRADSKLQKVKEEEENKKRKEKELNEIVKDL